MLTDLLSSTSRSVKGVDFSRQLAENRRERESQPPPTKKLKSSVGLQNEDRISPLRNEQSDEEEEDSLEKRVRALEEKFKRGEIDQATFDKRRRELGVGGDINSTHLVKGLDWDLLRRVKAGEDVTKPLENRPAAQEETNADEEFERVLEEKAAQVTEAAPREQKVKKGNLVQRRTRDEILRQLKESRAGAAAAESTLSSKFKKIDGTGEHEKKKKKKQRWIEEDPSGRRKEVLLIADEEGRTKRKVRWLDKEPPAAQPSRIENNGATAETPAAAAEPSGAEGPAKRDATETKREPEPEPEDEDIFEGVGADYNPLRELEEDDDDESADEGTDAKRAEPAPSKTEVSATTAKPRNYFSTATTAEETAAPDRSKPLTSDPTILAAIKRAAKLRAAEEAEAEAKAKKAKAKAGEGEEEKEDHGIDLDDDVDPEKLDRRRKFLEEARRRDELDAMDIDYGFGSSRIGDEEDEELEAGYGRKQRKRGPKKKKGNKDSAEDVLRVLEQRRQAG